MAVLIQDDAQLRALEEINAMLDEIRGLNAVIGSSDPYLIRVDRKQNITIDASFGSRIETILRAQRERRAKEISTKAARYRISLDESERQLIEESMARHPTED